MALSLAYERGRRGDTFATADEYRHPEYAENYARGMRARPDGDARAAACTHRSVTTADGHGAYCVYCGETTA